MQIMKKAQSLLETGPFLVLLVRNHLVCLWLLFQQLVGFCTDHHGNYKNIDVGVTVT